MRSIFEQANRCVSNDAVQLDLARSAYGTYALSGESRAGVIGGYPPENCEVAQRAYRGQCLLPLFVGFFGFIIDLLRLFVNSKFIFVSAFFADRLGREKVLGKCIPKNLIVFFEKVNRCRLNSLGLCVSI